MLSTSKIYNNLILEDLIYLSNSFTPIIEIAIDPPKKLITLEKVLDQYADPKSDFKELNKKISKILSDFTKTKIKFKMSKSDIGTAYIFPIYQLSNSATQLKKTNVLESLVHINNATIVVDYNLFYKKAKMNSAEIIGILLHEIGHLTYHTSFVPNLLKSLSKVTLRLSSIANMAATILHLLPRQLSVIIGSTVLLCSRTLSFFDHKEEYKCDQYAVKYGYGDELASAFIKLKEHQSGQKTSKRTILNRILNYVQTIFNISTHPTDINRICELSKTIQNQYVKDYPFLDKKLIKKLNLISC